MQAEGGMLQIKTPLDGQQLRMLDKVLRDEVKVTEKQDKKRWKLVAHAREKEHLVAAKKALKQSGSKSVDHTLGSKHKRLLDSPILVSLQGSPPPAIYPLVSLFRVKVVLHKQRPLPPPRLVPPIMNCHSTSHLLLSSLPSMLCPVSSPPNRPRQNWLVVRGHRPYLQPRLLDIRT